MTNWRDEILAESAQIARLAKDPAKIERIGKERRTLCKGGCGRRVWGDYCGSCRRKMARAEKKAKKAKR